MDWAPHVTVAVVVEHGERFLLVEEEIDGRLLFNQPAGHLDDGETLAGAALRETLEETAWEVELHAIVGIYQWRHPVGEETFVRFCFAATSRRHHPNRALDQGIRRATWLTRDEVAACGDRLRSPLVLRCIDDYRAGHRYPLKLLIRVPSS